MKARFVNVFSFVGLLLASWGNICANRTNVSELNFHIRHYTNNDGLSQNSVNDIERDPFGFLWFATGNGLSRFDGYTFRNYTKPLLPSNLVYALAVSPDKRIWIGTKQGLCFIDLASDRIEQFRLAGAEEEAVSVISLFCDRQGNVWAGTSEKGLFLLKPSSQGYRILHFDTANSELPGNHVGVAYQLKNGNVLVGTNHGAALFSIQANRFETWNQSQLQSSLVLSIFESDNGNIWLGTYFGLAVFDRASSAPIWHFPDPFNPASLSHGRINGILQDGMGRIFVGTLGGLDVYLPQTNSFFHVPQGQQSQFSLNSKFVNCLMADAQGNIWVGTEKGGINQMNIYQKPFLQMEHKVDIPNGLSNNTINSVLVEGNDFWIGTAGGGLNRYDARTGIYQHFKYNPANTSSISSDFITSLVKTPNDRLWVGTWGGGLCKADGNGTFKRFIPPVNNPETDFVNAFVSSIVYDKRGFLWIGTEGGLAILGLGNNTFLDLRTSDNALSQITEIGCLYLDSKDFLWVGTRNGLYRFPSSVLDNPDKVELPMSRLEVYRSSSQSPETGNLPGGYIISLLEDNTGTMWIGTYGDGLLKCKGLPGGKLSFEQFTQSDGLCNNVVYGIQQDDAGNLWLSTDHGLSCFDPGSNSFDNYFMEDGLLGDQFYWSASYKSADGRLFFGGVNGLNYFLPSAFPKYPANPHVAITALRVFNHPVALGEERHGQVAVSENLALNHNVSLSYKDNVFAIEFSALDFFHPAKVRYAYKLDGVDKDWVEVGANQRLANYTNLRGGDYVFKVKASNSDGAWSDQLTELNIHIRPPYWQTPWFRMLLVFFIVLLAIIYSRYHSRRLIVQKAKLEAMVQERTRRIETQTEELREANKVLEHRQELIEGQKKELESKNEEIMQQRDQLLALNEEIERNNQSRLKFFTNISHEFRTPLTLIVSPIERLVRETGLPQMVRDSLNVVHRNACRLHLLIDQLLAFREIETDNLRLVVTKGNFSEFVHDIVRAFEGLALQRRMEYSYVDTLNGQNIWFDREKVENILYNLLSNAFKYTPEGKNVAVGLGTALIDKDGRQLPAVQIEVADTGKGIAADQLGRIFDSFYRVPSHKGVNGTGIGLALTSELVGAMNGQIHVHSKEGEGSRFTVLLPCRLEDLGEVEVVDHVAGDISEIEQKVQVIQDLFHDDNHFLFEQQMEELSGKPVMLIVEDNKELCSFLSGAFSPKYRILMAENGKSGYELARKHAPDVVLSDVMMPEMDGIELCRQIKNNLYTSHIPVVLLTARAMVENQLEGLQTGADDYIPKPFNLDLLKAKIDNLVEIRSKLRGKFCAQTEIKPMEPATSSLDEKFLSKAYEILENNFHNPDFNVELFSDLMFVSRSLLYKKIKALVDLSPNDFITVFRLKKSVTLLAPKDISVNEVAYRIGFNDPKYFSRVFKKFYKKTPSEYTLTQGM
ncbi:MAG: two-component regulator propeller domain-containing protein [Breznakibacter sp.]